MNRDTLRRLLAARAEKRSVVLVTGIPSGTQRLVYAGDRTAGDPVDDATWEACLAAVRADRSTMTEIEGHRLFLQAHNPPLRMVIVGAVHITQALAPMAELAGFEVTVVDPRRAFAADHRFPSVHVRTDWPDEVLGEMGLDHRSAVVTLTHDPKLDDPALEVALGSRAFYIGSLGSTRTHSARLERLRRAGIPEATLARIHGPVGLPIGARSPAEIAVAVLAQVIGALRGAPRVEERAA